MKRYRDLSGRSGVTAYEDFDEAIAVLFQDGGLYLYDYEATGEDDVEEMKRLAEAGEGLATYISQVVGGRYARKLK
jgi:hypothetical protein